MRRGRTPPPTTSEARVIELLPRRLLAGGVVSQRWGLPAVFAAAALVSVAALGCCWRALRADQTAN